MQNVDVTNCYSGGLVGIVNIRSTESVTIDSCFFFNLESFYGALNVMGGWARTQLSIDNSFFIGIFGFESASIRMDDIDATIHGTTFYITSGEFAAGSVLVSRSSATITNTVFSDGYVRESLLCI